MIDSELNQTGASQQRTGLPPGEAATGVIRQAKGVAAQLADQAKGKVRDRVAERTSRSASDLGDVARALRDIGTRLEGNWASPFMSKVADRLEEASEALEVTSTEELVERVESIARRRPALFLGGAFTLGLAAARLFKSSASAESSPDEEARVATEPEAGTTIGAIVEVGEGEEERTP